MPWDPSNNPYNFIPFGPPVRLSKGAPSHRRIIGLTGSITVQLTNETPMLVAQRVSPQGEVPPRLENVKINGRLIIPATSLKGMVRSLLEAITNSCFAIFDGSTLDYRMATQNALRLKAGRITRMPTATTPGEVEEMDRAWIAMSGKPNTVDNIIGGGSKIEHIATAPAGATSGQEIWVRIITVYRERFIKGRKVRVGPFHLITDITSSSMPGYRKGIYKITRDSIPLRKKRERVFLYKNPAPTYSFDAIEAENYQRILKRQLEEHTKRGGFDLTERNPLQVGSLVYFEADGNKARRLSRVEIPRVSYQYSRADRLPSAYEKCSHPDQVCAACQLFGFIADLNGLRGRITFGDAAWIDGDGEFNRFLHLRVLGEPHPTSCNFYLRDPNDSNQVRNYDGEKITDGRGKTQGPPAAVELRGRKFYWHHRTKNWREYEIPPDRRQKFNSVRVLSKPIQPNNIFEFQVHFRNLSEAELGLLLYSLILEEPLRHKLGLAKALGFGTVKLTCKSLIICRPEKRYNSFGVSSEYHTGDIHTYVTAFKDAVKIATGRDFDQLINVAKLKKILDPSQAPSQVGYFFDPTGRIEGFNWYANNKNNPLEEL